MRWRSTAERPDTTMILMMRYSLFSLVALTWIWNADIAEGQENCNTALTRIARKAADKAIGDHQDNACTGLKKGPIAIDKTEALELLEFSLCENGPVVAASITVHIKCATSDQAVFQTDLEDKLTASVTANLDTCQVLDADISSEKPIGEAGIEVADLRTKLREAAEKEIKAYYN
jgi:hypothetical protein